MKRWLILAALIAATALCSCSQQAASDASITNVAKMRALFEEQKCATCHGPNGEGGVGPNFHSPILMTRSVQQIENQITNGSGVMPSFKGTLSQEQIHELATFVYREIQKR